MATPSRELGIIYGGYSVTKTDDVHIGVDGPDISSIRFDFEIADPDDTAFAAAKAAAETAFRTPRKDCVITMRGKTWKSLSHSSGTGFNAAPKIESQRQGRSSNSIIYTVRIDFGRPADVHDTSYRRNSTVRVTWTPDRRLHMEVDGVYTCNGSTSARAQYLSAIGTYADAILTALGGSFDLLEENVVNDDQNKVASFHRKYDEQRDGRNEATIVVETMSNTRKRVTISGTYSTILDATSSKDAYDSLYPTFKDLVLGAITLPPGASFEETTTRVESNDTDLVTTFTNVYDEMLDGRQDGSYQIIYSIDRRISVFFYATYFTGTSGVDAFALAQTDFPTWALGILSSIGGSYNKRSESYQPNDLVPPNHCSARLEFLERYTEQAPGLPAGVSDQNYKVERFQEAPGDYPGGNVKRMVELNIDYTATLSHIFSTNLVGIWNGILAWLISTIAPIYQTGVAVVVEQNPSFNPDNNIISSKVRIWIAPASLLLYSLDISDTIDQGTVFDGLWSGDPMDFHIYPSHITAIRKISKTYRRLKGGQAPQPILSTDLTDPKAPSSIGSGTGEGGDDPFGLGRLHAEVISREQPRKKVSEIGGATVGAKMTVEDITFTLTLRITNAPQEQTL
jgi:hypothetical protein